MKLFIKLSWLVVCIICTHTLYAQQPVTVHIIDKNTREPIAGATIQTTTGKHYVSNEKGQLLLTDTSTSLTITMIGYQPLQRHLSKGGSFTIAMEQQSGSMQQVIVSANRQVQQRTEAPIAISTINTAVIHDTRATTIDQLVNKTPGVFMVNLGSEQHMMAIRQPMTTKGLFLYLEDGIPVRTTGIFNHNALLEMNMTAVKSIEVIRGPSSSIYGAEAIGGAINFITRTAPVTPMARVELQGNNYGYRRGDVSVGNTFGKLGVAFNGYYAQNKNDILEHNDYHKSIGTLSLNYALSEKTKLIGTFTAMDYYADMRGSLDSASFSNKNYATPQTFTWRKVKGARLKAQLNHEWNDHSNSSIALVFRDNSVAQNPAYRVRDDYRRNGSVFTGNKTLAHGEINDNSFNSYVAIATHRQQFFAGKLNTVSGVSFDHSPSTYNAYYIRINQDTATRKYLGFAARQDSLLSDYVTNISNAAAYTQWDYKLFDNFRLVAGLRYDLFKLDFINHLPVTAFSGTPNTNKTFNRLTPKVGFTWQAMKALGFYANYSEGFVAPQVTELFNGVKVPSLEPQTFFNYEAGGWLSIWKDKIYLDWSVYRLEGTNEIISVRFDDGTFGNANAGKTRHQGIEYGLTMHPIKELTFRFSGSNSKHDFVNYVEREVKYDGKEMNGAPRFTANSELTYKPNWLPGFRTSIEWQHCGSYWMNQQNTSKYPGFDIANLRVGYEWKGLELWCNVINVLDEYYSINSSKSNSGYSYTIGNPRNFNIGVGYTFSKK